MVVLCHAFQEVPTVRFRSRRICLALCGGLSSPDIPDRVINVSRLARRVARGDVKIIESLDYSVNRLRPLSPTWENGLSRKTR